MISNPTTAATAASVAAGLVVLYLLWPKQKSAPGSIPSWPKSQPMWHMMLFGLNDDENDMVHNAINGTMYKPLGKMAKVGKMVKYDIFGRKFIAVTDAKLTRIMLSDPYGFQKTADTIKIMQMFCDAVFVIEGPAWKRHRAAMTPAFDQNHLQLVVQSAVKKNKELMKFWGGSGSVELREGFSRITMDVLGLVMYSYDFHNTSEKDAPAMRAISAIWKGMMNRFRMPHIVWQFHAASREFYNAKKVIRETIEHTLKVKGSALTAEQKSLKDMIDILIADDKLDDNEMIEEMMGLFFAGYETAAATMTVIFSHILTRPEVFRKTMEEIDSVIGDSDPTLTTINSLQYLDYVMKESMRFNPTLIGVNRRNMQEFEYDGMTFPKGTQFTIDFASRHFDPEYFEDPAAFKPERWANAADWLIPGAYIPFSDGPRRCIGERMAQLEIKTTVAMMLHHYNMELVPEQDLEPFYQLTVGFKNGLWVNLSPRNEE